jgi:hypothetical protein
MDSKDRVFDTQFVGLDIAGEYIKENSEESETILFPGHQSYGILWHADRKGFAEIPGEEDIIFAENERNVRWIFLYQWGMNVINSPQWEYISTHYSLKQIALMSGSGEQFKPVYLLLEKGGSFDANSLEQMLEGKEQKVKSYENSNGFFDLVYFSFD